MLRKNSKRSFAILLSSLLLLGSCTTVKLKDGQACGDMGPRLGATCDNIFTNKPVDYDAREWDQRRVGRISLPSSLFANWKAALIKFCDDTGRCTIEEEDAVEEVGKKLNRLDRKMKKSMMMEGIEPFSEME